MSRALKVTVELKHDCEHSPLYKYITRNSEYVIRGDRCRQLQERRPEGDRSQSDTVERRVIASVRWRRDGGYHLLLGGLPEVGDSLLMGDPGHEILTSVVQRIEPAPSPTA